MSRTASPRLPRQGTNSPGSAATLAKSTAGREPRALAHRTSHLGGLEVRRDDDATPDQVGRAVLTGRLLHDLDVDRNGLRRLAGCIARPPLALDRARIAWNRPWSDGTMALELSAEELAERLLALVPPPRAIQAPYGGVLTSRDQWHREVRPRSPMRRVAPAGVGVRLTKASIGSSRRTSWRVLLWRIFNIIGLACPTCGKLTVLRAEVRRPGRRAADAAQAGVARAVGARACGRGRRA